MANVITYGTFDFFHARLSRVLDRAKEFYGEGRTLLLA